MFGKLGEDCSEDQHSHSNVVVPSEEEKIRYLKITK